MTTPSSPLSSTSSLTAESAGAPSISHLPLADLDAAFEKRPSLSNSGRRSSSSSTLTTTTVMLPSDEDRDESDLTEAEDDETDVGHLGELAIDANTTFAVVNDTRESSLPSDDEEEGSSVEGSASLSPAPQPSESYHAETHPPEPNGYTSVSASDLQQGRFSFDRSPSKPLSRSSRDASPVTAASEADDDDKSHGADVESAQGENEAHSGDDVPVATEESALPALADGVESQSPKSDTSQGEVNGEMDINESVHEGSVADDDDNSLTSPLLASGSRSGHSAHAPPPTSDAMRAMFLLELKFAALRDQLYIDRMDEAAREEDLILNGLHPAVVYLHSTLARRRERLHADARRRHRQAMVELQRVRDAEKKAVANWWLETREATQWGQYEGNWRKRRRLNREKNELEILRPMKPLPPRLPSDRDMEERSFCWSMGPRASTLTAIQVGHDLTNMGLRSRPASYSRHASPAYFPSSLSGHPSALHSHYGAHTNSPSMFSNIYRPTAAPGYYPEEGTDYAAHMHQEPSLIRPTNGHSSKHASVSRPHPHSGFAGDTQDMMYGHSQSSQMTGGAGTLANSAAQSVAQRREGRMVPTTADSAHIFDVRRREKDHVRDKASHDRLRDPSIPPLPSDLGKSKPQAEVQGDNRRSAIVETTDVGRPAIDVSRAAHEPLPSISPAVLPIRTPTSGTPSDYPQHSADRVKSPKDVPVRGLSHYNTMAWPLSDGLYEASQSSPPGLRQSAVVIEHP